MKNIIETALDAGMFKTLVSAIQSAELTETLNGNGPFTVFAPNDEAFTKIPKETLDDVLGDKSKITKILTYHVVTGKVMSRDIVTMTSMKTIEGGEIEIKNENGVHINDATVITADIECTNGVIHIIDGVLMPK